MTFTIIWPERRNVSAAQIAIWYDDALANGEIAHTGPRASHDDMALALHAAGLITLRATICTR